MSALVYGSSKAASQQTLGLWKHVLVLVLPFSISMILSENVVI